MQKPKSVQRKLTLGKQTIRSLSDIELPRAAGGFPTESSGSSGGGQTVGNSRCNGCTFFTFGC
jgi:hypothetical protein